MRFSGKKPMRMGVVRHIEPFLELFGMGLLILLMIGLGLELLATVRAKTRDLKAKTRLRGMVYLAVPLLIAAVLFLWLLSRFRS